MAVGTQANKSAGLIVCRFLFVSSFCGHLEFVVVVNITMFVSRHGRGTRSLAKSSLSFGQKKTNSSRW